MSFYPTGRPAPRPLPALPESRVGAPTSAESRRSSAIEREIFKGTGDFYIMPWATGANPVIHHAAFDLFADGDATFSGDLSAASGTFGTITSGLLQGTNITINLDATGTQKVIEGADWFIRANGAIELGTEVSIDSSGNATFSGALSAASGTFSGTVSAAAVVASETFSASLATFQGNVFLGGNDIIMGTGAIKPGSSVTFAPLKLSFVTLNTSGGENDGTFEDWLECDINGNTRYIRLFSL